MNRILVIEDDKEICLMIKDYFEKYDYQVSYVLSGANAAEQIISSHPDLVILDLMLPFVSGDELLKKIRSFSDVPVIVVSAKSLTYTKIELLRLGADDYVTKPFDLGELLARVEVVLKRSNHIQQERHFVAGSLSLDTTSTTCTVEGDPVSLTAREYQILLLLMEYPDKVFSKQNLFESVWQEPFARDNDVINTHISNLRKKLKSEGNRIETVWGLGYRFKGA